MERLSRVKQRKARTVRIRAIREAQARLGRARPRRRRQSHAARWNAQWHASPVTSKRGPAVQVSKAAPAVTETQGVSGSDGECQRRGRRHRTYVREPGRHGRTGGAGGKTGNGGNGGNVIVQTFAGASQSTVTGTLTSGIAGQQATGGPPGAPGPGGLGGFTLFISCNRYTCYCSITSDRTGSGPQGDPGAIGATASAGTAGVAGSMSTPTATDADFQALFPLSLAHEVLRAAEQSYFNSQFADAATRLQWLAQAAPPGSGSSSDEWSCLATRVQVLLQQLQKGLNFYGQRSNHVPLASVSTYLNTLQGLITAGQAVETDYQFFTNQENDNQDRIAKLQNQINGLSQSIQQLPDGDRVCRRARGADEYGDPGVGPAGHSADGCAAEC